jgi:hypothetical protein
MACASSMTGMAVGFYALFGLSVAVTRSFTGWDLSHLNAYLVVGLGAGISGACGGWIIAHLKS